MDGTRFDSLTRELATRVTRRRAFAGLLGMASGAAALAGADEAVAVRRCRLAGDKCVKASQCCSGLCDQRRTVPRNQRNRCICPSGLTSCRGVCTELGTEDNCGRCGDTCPPTQVCEGGACVCPDSGDVYCRASNACVPLGTEADCLGCGDTCENGDVCCSGDGCTELGTVDHCLDCDDACSTSGTGSSRVICNGDNGCQTVCQAAAGGFVTTDEPPVIYPGSVANNSSHLAYLRPLLSDPNVFQTCETSADCTAPCPTNILLNGGTVPATGVACGCIKYMCRPDGGEYFHFINQWNEIPADTYVCMVLMKE